MKKDVLFYGLVFAMSIAFRYFYPEEWEKT